MKKQVSLKRSLSVQKDVARCLSLEARDLRMWAGHWRGEGATVKIPFKAVKIQIMKEMGVGWGWGVKLRVTCLPHFL